MRLRGCSILLLAFLGGGCQPSMNFQPKYKPLSPSRLFSDGASARPLPAGVVARGHLMNDDHLYRGLVKGAPASAFPIPVTITLLERGRERFEISCAPCHGRDGYGKGIVPARGFTAPPSFHVARLRQAPVGELFRATAFGQGVMFGYGDLIAARDVWAIVAYIRALQLSQNARASDLSADDRDRLRGGS